MSADPLVRDLRRLARDTAAISQAATDAADALEEIPTGLLVAEQEIRANAEDTLRALTTRLSGRITEA